MRTEMVYIVITGTPYSDFKYHIDSVWTSERKAEKRCNELNSDAMTKWRDSYGYQPFVVEQEFIRTKTGGRK